MSRGRSRAVAVLSVAAVALALSATASATGLRSTFSSSAEGWTAFDGDLAFLPTGGHPGGNIAVDDTADACCAVAVAPESWDGNRSTAYGGTLSFDIQVQGGSGARRALAIIVAGGGHTLTYHRPLPTPGPSWKTASIPLREKGDDWVVDSTSPATRLDFFTVLGDLDEIDIFGDVYDDDSGDTAFYDNITLASTVKRRLTINYNNRKFKGKLRPVGPCSEGQAVTVYRRKRGRDAKIGTDRASVTGAYAVRKRNARAGRYYAAAKKRFVSGTGNCLAAKSKAVKVP